MSELRDLYQEVILEHAKRPRHFGRPEGATCKADGHNPLCGDRVTVYVTLDGDTIRDVAFEGAGCAISTASASLMSEALCGKSVQDAARLFSRFHDAVTGAPLLEDADLGKLEALTGVKEFPARVKCATLAWHTLQAAIRGGELVSTEAP